MTSAVIVIDDSHRLDLPPGWAWKDRLPFSLIAASATGRVTVSADGIVDADHAPHVVVDAILTRFEHCEVVFIPEPDEASFSFEWTDEFSDFRWWTPLERGWTLAVDPMGDSWRWSVAYHNEDVEGAFVTVWGSAHTIDEAMRRAEDCAVEHARKPELLVDAAANPVPLADVDPLTDRSLVAVCRRLSIFSPTILGFLPPKTSFLVDGLIEAAKQGSAADLYADVLSLVNSLHDIEWIFDWKSPAPCAHGVRSVLWCMTWHLEKALDQVTLTGQVDTDGGGVGTGEGEREA